MGDAIAVWTVAIGLHVIAALWCWVWWRYYKAVSNTGSQERV
jgi:hypothetical protein